MNNAFSRYAAVIVASLFPFLLQAQVQDSIAPADTVFYARPNMFDGFNQFYMNPFGSHFEGHLVEGTFAMEGSSNSAVNNLAYDLYLKNSVRGDAIKTTVSKFSEINIGGRDNNYGAKFIFPVKKGLSNQFMFVTYNYRSHQSVRFSGEFGKFFFEGNKQFAGKEIYADDMHYRVVRYDALQYGWMKYFSLKGKRAIISVSGGISRGFDYKSIDVKKGRIFTEENGDYIEAVLDMNAKRTYSSPYGTQLSGIGGIAGAKFNLLLNEKSAIGVEVSDLGFVNWTKSPAEYDRGDTTIRFDGLFVPSADSLGSQQYMEQIGDSIVNRFKIPYKDKAFISGLPARISLTYYMGFTAKNFLNVRLQLMVFTPYRPQLSIESINFINSRLFSTTGVSLGGFGPLDIYQSIGWQISKRWFTSIGLFGIEGMVAPAQTSGFGGHVSVSMRY